MDGLNDHEHEFWKPDYLDRIETQKIDDSVTMVIYMSFALKTKLQFSCTHSHLCQHCEEYGGAGLPCSGPAFAILLLPTPQQGALVDMTVLQFLLPAR